jgi:hypothetical protein
MALGPISARPQITWTLVGLLIAAIGVAAPIAWDQYKTRSALELQILSRTTLVQRADALRKLEIRYDGKPIPGVSRMEFVLINSGRTPIKSSDLVAAPTLTFMRHFEILDIEEIDRSPKDLEADLALLREANAVRVTFPLLNPSDYLRFALIVAGSEPTFTASARVVGITKLQVIDRVETVPRTPIRWPVYIAAVFSVLSLVAVGLAVNDLLRDAELKRRAAKGTLFPKPALTKNEFKALFEGTFDYRITPNLAPVRKQLDELPDNNEPLSDDARTTLESSAVQILKDGGGADAAAIVFGVIALVGLIYVVWHVS